MRPTTLLLLLPRRLEGFLACGVDFPRYWHLSFGCALKEQGHGVAQRTLRGWHALAFGLNERMRLMPFNYVMLRSASCRGAVQDATDNGFTVEDSLEVYRKIPFHLLLETSWALLGWLPLLLSMVTGILMWISIVSSTGSVGRRPFTCSPGQASSYMTGLSRTSVAGFAGRWDDHFEAMTRMFDSSHLA